MADITTISTILTSIKTATDIAKLLKDSNSSLETAEYKLQLADLVSNLADVKIEVAELQDSIRSRDERIRELEGQIKYKARLRFDGELYWMEGDETPFCTLCLENEKKTLHLLHIQRNEFTSEKWYCRACSTDYYI